MPIFRATTVAACMLLSSFVPKTFAQTSPGLGFIVEGGGEFGGGHVATVEFTDGSEQHINAGAGVTLSAGGDYGFTENWDVRATVGYKYVTTKADNANIYLDRVVVKAVADYTFDRSRWFIGGGVVNHIGTKLHADGLGPDVDFRNATGGVIEAGWSFVALSYTFMDYKDDAGDKVNANNVGILFTGRFGGARRWATGYPDYAPAPVYQAPLYQAPVSPVTVSPSVAPTAPSGSQARAGAALKQRPLGNATVLSRFDSPTTLTLQQGLVNAEGKWWFATAANGSNGWISDADLVSP